MTNWNILSRYLFEFENAYGRELSTLKYKDFNAWQIVKIPLYFNNINAISSPSASVRPKYSSFKFLKKIVGFFRLLLRLLGLWIGSSLRPANRVLFFTFSGDKLAKDENNKHFNFLVDGFVSADLVRHYIYAEASLNGNYKQPSRVNIDFKVDPLYMLFPFFKKMSKDEVSEAELCVSRINEKLESFSMDHGFMKADVNTLSTIFYMFNTELKLFRFFLRICRPRLIITSEKPGTSFLAAAKGLNIPVLDIQHGIIDKHHPQYIYASEMITSKKDMILPNWIGLFGNFHKDILLKTGFWQESELVILGSSRMEVNRHKYNIHGVAKDIILIPTQWTYYRETCDFLERLLPLVPSKFKVVLKLHPLERAEHISGYARLIEKSGYDNIKISAKDDDIYPMISSSRFVIGFDSAVLLEAISLGTPCITLCTEECPEGIHSLFTESTLKISIKPVNLNEPDELAFMISNTLNNESFYCEWVKEVAADSENLFARNYDLNCREFLRQHVDVN